MIFKREIQNLTHSREKHLALILGKFIVSATDFAVRSGSLAWSRLIPEDLDEKKEGKRRGKMWIYTREEVVLSSTIAISIFVNPLLRFLALDQALDYVGQQGDFAVPREILTGGRNIPIGSGINARTSREKERKRRARASFRPRKHSGGSFSCSTSRGKRIGWVKAAFSFAIAIIEPSLSSLSFSLSIYRGNIQEDSRLSLSPWISVRYIRHIDRTFLVDTRRSRGWKVGNISFKREKKIHSNVKWESTERKWQWKRF